MTCISIVNRDGKFKEILPEAMTAVQTTSVLSDCNHHQLPLENKYMYHDNPITDLAPVVQRMDNAIH